MDMAAVKDMKQFCCGCAIMLDVILVEIFLSFVSFHIVDFLE